MNFPVDSKTKRFAAPMLPALTILAVLAAAAIPFIARVRAQSLPDTVEAIRKARVTTRIMFVTAHPDDEWSGLLAYLSRGLDADVALLTITRGQGGQNAIGPEQDGQLGVVRTEELLAAGQHYGVRQFFTRAVDTGFSKSPETTMKIWGELPVEDMTRAIRTFRPNVVINGWGGVHSGHGQHQASGIMTPQAVAAAADPHKFPDQIAEGLPAWKVSLDLRGGPFGASSGVEIPVNSVSQLWGKSYTLMGMEGHAMHVSQGTPAFFGNPFFRRAIYLSTESEKDDAGGKFDTKLLAEPITTLADRFPGVQPLMAPALASADQSLADAEKEALALDRAAAAKSLADAGKSVAALREELAQQVMRQIKQQGGAEATAALWEVDRLGARIDKALEEDVALSVEVEADKHELVAGENFSVDVRSYDHPAVPVQWSVEKSSLETPTGWSVKLAEPKDAKSTTPPTSYHFDVTIPAGAEPPHSPGDAILPFPPPLVQVALRVDVDGYQFDMRKAAQADVSATTGIRTYQLELVPAVTLTAEPRQVMVPEKRAAEPVKLFARVRYHGTKPAKVAVGIDGPKGWSAAPIAPLEFSEAGDQLIRFSVTPPAGVAPGAYPLHPYAKIGEESFRTSLEPIPTLPTRDWSSPDDATAHVLSLNVPAGLRIGYITADSDDPMPEVLRQLGIRVDLLDEVALAFGDLDRYDAIVVGIRGYELRSDLPRSNTRLLDYVKRGGSLVVQYQRDFAWDKILPAPFPAKMGDKVARVTDAQSPVKFLAPQNPLLNTPNKISLADFDGWVQERGLYFWGTFDSKYTPVLGLNDPGEPEATAGLVYARDGRGVYIYTGLSFFRELPAGVPGAYRLFVNLLSQTQRGASTASKAAAAPAQDQK